MNEETQTGRASRLSVTARSPTTPLDIYYRYFPIRLTSTFVQRASDVFLLFGIAPSELVHPVSFAAHVAPAVQIPVSVRRPVSRIVGRNRPARFLTFNRLSWAVLAFPVLALRLGLRRTALRAPALVSGVTVVRVRMLRRADRDRFIDRHRRLLRGLGVRHRNRLRLGMHLRVPSGACAGRGGRLRGIPCPLFVHPTQPIQPILLRLDPVGVPAALGGRLSDDPLPLFGSRCGEVQARQVRHAGRGEVERAEGLQVSG